MTDRILNPPASVDDLSDIGNLIGRMVDGKLAWRCRVRNMSISTNLIYRYVSLMYLRVVHRSLSPPLPWLRTVRERSWVLFRLSVTERAGGLSFLELCSEFIGKPLIKKLIHNPLAPAHSRDLACERD